jgi:hypothetical protein
MLFNFLLKVSQVYSFLLSNFEEIDNNRTARLGIDFELV